MKKMGTVVLALLLILPSGAFALPIGDAPNPPYAEADHLNQYYEWLGTSGNADDGITFSSFVPGEPAWVTFSASTLYTGYEYVNVWIDWDQSGTWEDNTAEEVLDWDGWVPAGINSLTHTSNFTVPTDALFGETWLRARLTWGGEAGPTGTLTYGEVEDYKVSVVPEPATVLLLGSGLVGLAGFRKKFKK